MHISLKALPLYACAALFLSACATTQQPPQPPSRAAARFEAANWSQLPGWQADRSQEAWSAFLQSCVARGMPVALKAPCAAAQNATQGAAINSAEQARQFFETRFTPYRVMQIEAPRLATDTGLITGYYEPLLRGARKPSAVYKTPLYAPPDDMLTIDMGDLFPELQGKRVRGRVQGKKVVPYYDRASLQGQSPLKGKELVWVDNPVDAFFLEVQGSGRVQLPDGKTIRLAYADQNGHPYRSIGRYLVDQGEMTLDGASAPAIRDWIAAHPQRQQEVLNANPSVVFFREEHIDDPAQGPKGSLGVPLTGGRSVAVDPKFIPLGAPLFLATTQPLSEVPLQKLVMAQDTGGAIRGPVRADFFWGFGAAAGELAGRMKQQGRLWLLWPKGEPLPP